MYKYVCEKKNNLGPRKNKQENLFCSVLRHHSTEIEFQIFLLPFVEKSLDLIKIKNSLKLSACKAML